MELLSFYIRAAIYIVSLIASFYGLQALPFEKMIKVNHVAEARLLYGLLCLALAYLVGSFICVFLYRV